MLVRGLAMACLVFLSVQPPAEATFSIVARDPETGELGVGVASRILAVGALVPYAKAGVGAVATQALANPNYGPAGLALLREGISPENAVARLAREDPGREDRQLAVMDARGRVQVWTGKKSLAWSGHRTGRDYSVQGNLLASERVLAAMAEAFERASGSLAQRLLAVLEAGQDAGGDRRGRQSAAILVVREGAGYVGLSDRYVDLRVDDHEEPVRELGRLLRKFLKASQTPGRTAAESTTIPASIPVERSAFELLTAELRKKTTHLGLNGMKGLHGDRLSRALALLPEDRAQPGVISFEIEEGPNAGSYQCEMLGRGSTSLIEKPGWTRSSIDGTTIYYVPMEFENGATPLGVYDLRNISTDTYEIELLNSPAGLQGEEDVLARTRSPAPESKRHFSGAWKTWYSRTNHAVPIDMIWSEEYQAYSEAARFPLFERRPQPKTDAEKAFQGKQLRRNKRYYHGPYGRYGLAIHTDRWDDPERKADPRYAGRRELADFRLRDTDGCIKVRADCLQLLNVFIAEQARKGRRVQLDVRGVRPPEQIREP